MAPSEKNGVKELQAAAKCRLKHFQNGDADIGVVALAGHVNEGRYEALELVAADENARPRRQICFHDLAGNLGELSGPRFGTARLRGKLSITLRRARSEWLSCG